MPIFKLSAAKPMRLLSGHIFPRKALNFTCSHLDLKNFLRGETPDPCLQGWEGKEGEWEANKGFLPLKEGEGWKEERRGER